MNSYQPSQSRSQMTAAAFAIVLTFASIMAPGVMTASQAHAQSPAPVVLPLA